MSPTKRRYRVQCLDWSVYEIIVEATSVRQAKAKAEAIYEADSYGEFSFVNGGIEDWEVEEVKS